MIKKSLRIGSRLILTLGIIGCVRSCNTESERSNFILIQMDDVGWDDLSIHGNQIIETPNIDRLAGESVQFSSV